MKVAIIQEWLITLGGSEKVVQALVELYPDADIFTLVADDKMVKQLGFEGRVKETSIIQKLPFGKKHYKFYLPLFPFAIEQMKLSDYDVIISSNHAVAKGVLTNSEQLHISYCHSPVRYAWDLYYQYLDEARLGYYPKGLFARIVLHYLRIWDIISANRVDYFVSNSNFIGRRIKRVYNRPSQTIYPPIEVDSFTLCETKENYYVACSRLVPYKKIDLIVKAFNDMPEKRLIVIGDGPDYKLIKSIANRNIELLGFLKFNDLIHYIQNAKAFVFAAIEDFGMLPVEAQACGTPVIALGQGGVLETVIHGETGILFRNQTKEAIIEAVHLFEQHTFDYKSIRKHAEKFSKERFKKELKAFIDDKVAERRVNIISYQRHDSH